MLKFLKGVLLCALSEKILEYNPESEMVFKIPANLCVLFLGLGLGSELGFV